MSEQTLPRETLKTVLVTWIIRVGLVGIILYAVQEWFGPFEFLWWAWPVYAAISLISSLLLMRIKNQRTDELEALLKHAQEKANDP